MHCSFVVLFLLLIFNGRRLARPSTLLRPTPPPPSLAACTPYTIFFQESYLYPILIHASISTTATFMCEQKWREKQSEYAWVDATVLSLDARRQSTRTSPLPPTKRQRPTHTRYLTGSSLGPSLTQQYLGPFSRMASHDTPTR